MDQKGAGIHLRTFARSFIVDDGDQRFVFVSVESAMIGHDVRSSVRLQFVYLLRLNKMSMDGYCSKGADLEY